MTTYDGLYRARVVNNNDPQKANRLTLQVPQIMGDSQTPWAEAANTVIAVPNPGDLVWASFHGGDLRYPIWWGGEPDVSSQITAANAYADEQAGAAAEAASKAQQTADKANADLAVANRVNYGRYLKKDVSQSVAAESWTNVVWNFVDKEIIDDGEVGLLGPDKIDIVPNVSGIWEIQTTVTFAPSTGYQALQLVTAANSILAQAQFNSASLFPPVLSVSYTQYFPAGYAGIRARVISTTNAAIAVHGFSYGGSGTGATEIVATLLSRA